MHNPDSLSAADGRAGRQLHTLYEEAYQQLEPLFAEAPEQSFSTLMFLALHRLRRHYPQLTNGELEALFMGLMKYRQDSPRH